MARRDKQPSFNVDDAVRVFQSLPQQAKLAALALVLLAAVVAGVYFLFWKSEPAGGPGAAGAGEAGTYQFCTWNVENFFDDEDDPANNDDMENWFGRNPDMFRAKVDQLASALLMMNDGRGPDILSLCEVESQRCLEALRDAVNARFEGEQRGDLKYMNVLFERDATGRHFAPGILTRLPVVHNRTRQLKAASRMQRILEGHVRVNDHDLVVIAAHWTSRLRNDEASAEHRMLYAQKCYGEARAILAANTDADVLVCGDFNDEFRDPSLQRGLHASDDPAAVRQAVNEPLLLDLCAHLDRQLDPKGTIEYQGRWQVFDHICVSRGLLDERGWSCEPGTTEIFGPRKLRIGTDGRPFGFGRERHDGARGYSDHLPVTTRLRVEGTAPVQ